MNARLQEVIGEELAALKRAGTYKELRYLDSPMAPSVEMEGRGRVLVFSSNNYLGLSDHSEVRTAGVEGIARFGACLLYTSPSPRDRTRTRMPSYA